MDFSVTDSLLLIHCSVELPDSLLLTTAILTCLSLLGVQKPFLLAQFMSLWISMKGLLKNKPQNQESGINQL